MTPFNFNDRFPDSGTDLDAVARRTLDRVVRKFRAEDFEEDLAQELFVAVAAAVAAFDPTKSVRVGAVARFFERTIFFELRRRLQLLRGLDKSWRELPTRSIYVLDELATDFMPFVDPNAATSERRDELDDAERRRLLRVAAILARLTPKQRETLRRCERGESFAQIAAAFGVTKQTIAERVRRLKIKLGVAPNVGRMRPTKQNNVPFSKEKRK